MHTLPSLQFGATPPTHWPPEHVSLVVHAFPSLQALVLLVNTQPLAGLQESLVHGLPSLHTGAGPPTHCPPEHESLVVQALPSLQLPDVGANTQPDAGLQESAVQTLLSLHTSVPAPTHTPLEQKSPVVQALPSLQLPEVGVLVQPVAALQESTVQTLPSLQLGAGPPTH